VAIVSSVFVAAALFLVVYLLTVAVRRARVLFADDLLDRGIAHGAAIGRDLVGRELSDRDQRSSFDQWCGVLIGGGLIASAGLTLGATFVPLYRALPRGTPNFTLGDGLHYAAVVWYLEIALLATMGLLAFRRRDRVIAAVVVGYCAPAIGSVSLTAVFFTLPHSNLGPAYYLLQISGALEVVALVIAVLALVARSTDRAQLRVRSIRVGIPAALLLAVSAPMNLTRVPSESLWSFGLDPSRSVPAIVVNAVVLALVPLVAIRLRDQTGSLVALGLAVVIALSAASAALTRLSTPVVELTVGFWLTAMASATLFLLVGSLRPHDRVTPVTAVPAAIRQ